MERVGQNASVVRQDKGNTALCGAEWDSSSLRRGFWRRQRTVRTVLHGVLRTLSHGASPKRSARVVFALGATITGAMVLIVGGRFFQLRIILTDSAAPAGIYRLIAAPGGRGALVAACLPAAAARTGLTRGYLQAGDCPGGAEPVAKVIGALPGDVVEVAPDGVAVNGVPFANSRTAARDSAGRPLTHVAWGARRVAAGEVWLFGVNNRRSWDARYFGAAPQAAVRGVLQPVVTW
jgi:conjugative transfer signal peptidase TraF